MADLDRNGWPIWNGISGRFGAESPIVLFPVDIAFLFIRMQALFVPVLIKENLLKYDAHKRLISFDLY